MDFLIAIIVIGAAVFFLPYVIAGGVMIVGLIGGLLYGIGTLLKKIFS